MNFASSETGTAAPQRDQLRDLSLKIIGEVTKELSKDLTVGVEVRTTYLAMIRTWSDVLIAEVDAGRIDPLRAMTEMHDFRGVALRAARKSLRDDGGVISLMLSEGLKEKNVSIRTLIRKYAAEVAKEDGLESARTFWHLDPARQARVYAKIVRAGGRGSRVVTHGSLLLQHTTKTFHLLTIGLTIHQIAIAENPLDEAARTGFGVAGGILATAITGAAIGNAPGFLLGIVVGIIGNYGGTAFYDMLRADPFAGPFDFQATFRRDGMTVHIDSLHPERQWAQPDGGPVMAIDPADPNVPKPRF